MRSLKRPRIFDVWNRVKTVKEGRSLVDESGGLRGDLKDGGRVFVFARHSPGHAQDWLRVSYGMLLDVTPDDNEDAPPKTYNSGRQRRNWLNPQPVAVIRAAPLPTGAPGAQSPLACPPNNLGSVQLPRRQRPFDLLSESGHSGSLLSFAFRSRCFIRHSGAQFLYQTGALDRTSETAQRDFHRFVQLGRYSSQFSSWL